MGLNDPQWGKKNSGGPPDLDELLRKLNEKVAALMGGKGGKGGEGGPGRRTQGPAGSGRRQRQSGADPRHPPTDPARGMHY